MRGHCAALAFVVVLSIFAGFISAGEKAEKDSPEKLLAGKKVLMVIASGNFRDEEYREPRDILEEKGAKITVASSRKTESVGMLKKEKVTPDKLIGNVKAKDFDAIIFIGGPGAKEFFNNADAHRLAKSAVREKKVLGAICIAPAILANAGVLKGKKATAFFSVKKTLKKGGAKFVEKDVVTDGLIITANGPKAAKKFGEAVAKALEKK